MVLNTVLYSIVLFAIPPQNNSVTEAITPGVVKNETKLYDSKDLKISIGKNFVKYTS